MDIFDLLNFFLGLAMFLFGMHYMGEGLESCAGGRLQHVLEKLTASPIKGFTLGLFVTAVIQSSSATSVMVVGFVNSAVMTLKQAIPLIIGANVGTTVTGWLVSLTSISGAGLVIQLLKPSSWVPILAMAGAYFLVMDKSGRHKDLAAVLLGFAVLMVGMDGMSGSVSGLKDIPAFVRLLEVFSNPILGVLVGLALTAVMQSSSASIGVLQALSMTGSITMGEAIPMVLGMNIGASVPILLSAAGAGKEARRTSYVYLVFNIINMAVFMLLYAAASLFFSLPFMEISANPVRIALFHTAYKLVFGVAMLPFSGVLEKLVCLFVKDDTKQKQPLLDDRLMTTPAIALAQALRVTTDTALLCQNAYETAVSLLDKWDDKKAQLVRDLENEVDEREDELGSYLVKLSALNLSETENRQLSTILHTISDFERISDHAVGILISIRASMDSANSLSSGAKTELKRMAAAVSEALSLSIASFSTNNVEAARRVEPLEEVVDAMGEELKDHHIDRLKAGSCSVESGFIFTDLISNLSRVSDHCSNIAACVAEMQKGTFDTHKYVHRLHHSGDRSYSADYDYFSHKYSL